MRANLVVEHSSYPPFAVLNGHLDVDPYFVCPVVVRHTSRSDILCAEIDPSNSPDVRAMLVKVIPDNLLDLLFTLQNSALALKVVGLWSINF